MTIWIVLGSFIILWVIGFVSFIFDYRRIEVIREDLIDYHTTLIEFINELFNNRKFNQQKYAYCVENESRIQQELGADGIIAYMQDPLKGVAVRNYQLIVNALVEFREMSGSVLQSNYIYLERMNRLAGDCDDAFHRRIGNLDDRGKKIKDESKNPIKCICTGIRILISLPFKLLNWCGLIKEATFQSISNSGLMKFISGLIAVIGLISSIVTITTGWDAFLNLLNF